jgi:hypothetical protein
MKMGRRLRCSSVTYRFRYAPSYRQSGSAALPCRRPILIATKYLVFRGQLAGQTRPRSLIRVREPRLAPETALSDS